VRRGVFHAETVLQRAFGEFERQGPCLLQHFGGPLECVAWERHLLVFDDGALSSMGKDLGGDDQPLLLKSTAERRVQKTLKVAPAERDDFPHYAVRANKRSAARITERGEVRGFYCGRGTEASQITTPWRRFSAPGSTWRQPGALNYERRKPHRKRQTV